MNDETTRRNFDSRGQEVSDVVVYARQNGLPLAARGGRHSFAGYCNAGGGIVADVSAMRAISYDPASQTVLVGAGADVLDIYRDVVLAHGVWFPVGTPRPSASPG